MNTYAGWLGSKHQRGSQARQLLLLLLLLIIILLKGNCYQTESWGMTQQTLSFALLPSLKQKEPDSKPAGQVPVGQLIVPQHFLMPVVAASQAALAAVHRM
jgi:hypothetical protein